MTAVLMSWLPSNNRVWSEILTCHNPPSPHTAVLTGSGAVGVPAGPEQPVRSPAPLQRPLPNPPPPQGLGPRLRLRGRGPGQT